MKILSNLHMSQEAVPTAHYDVVVVGAGPYGLSTAAHLQERGLRVAVSLSDGKTLSSDHVMLATGYRVDVKNLPMLHPSLLSKIETYQNARVLNYRFESSVSGLYFLGLSSVSSCGPLYRFVVGTKSAARRVADAVARQVAAQSRGK